MQIARPLGEIDQSLDGLADRIVFISIIATVVAAAAGWFISGGTVAPIRRLTDAAERVAETGDLEQPVDGSGGAEVGRLAGSFNAMLEALSASRRQQHRLVVDASHELRTPLASLQTNIDVLRSERDIPEETRAAIVDDIHAEIAELGDLVAELVDLATDVRTDEDLAPVELAELAALIVERQAAAPNAPSNSTCDGEPWSRRARRRCPGRSATWSRTPPSSRPTRHRSR